MFKNYCHLRKHYTKTKVQYYMMRRSQQRFGSIAGNEFF